MQVSPMPEGPEVTVGQLCGWGQAPPPQAPVGTRRLRGAHSLRLPGPVSFTGGARAQTTEPRPALFTAHLETATPELLRASPSG